MEKITATVPEVNNEERFELKREIKFDGVIWFLEPRASLFWPNGKIHRVVYKTIWDNKLVIWLDETGGLIHTKCA